MQRFKNILVVIDGQTESQVFLAQAVDLAKRNQARMTVVSVIEEPPDYVHRLSPHKTEEELQETLIQAEEYHLELILAPVREDEVQIEVDVLFGIPFLEIIREVLRNEHDLVIVAAEGMGRVQEMLFGSTAMYLMRKCPCPVWVIKPEQPKQYSRILAAVDPTSCCEEHLALNIKIMDLATSLAQLEQGELHIVHTWDLHGETSFRAHAAMPEIVLARWIREIRDEHQHCLDDLLQDYPVDDQDYEVHLLKGNAGTLIPELAQEKAIELIVMGTVCRTGVSGMLIGNTAETVLRRVDCSVLAVKPDGFVTPVMLDN